MKAQSAGEHSCCSSWEPRTWGLDPALLVKHSQIESPRSQEMPQKFAEELHWSSHHSSGAVEISSLEGLFSLSTCVYPRTISNVLLLLLWSWFLHLLHTTTLCGLHSVLVKVLWQARGVKYQHRVFLEFLWVKLSSGWFQGSWNTCGESPGSIGDHRLLCSWWAGRCQHGVWPLWASQHCRVRTKACPLEHVGFFLGFRAEAIIIKYMRILSGIWIDIILLINEWVSNWSFHQERTRAHI